MIAWLHRRLRTLRALLVAALEPPPSAGDLIRLTQGPWRIEDGLEAVYPIPLYARVRAGGPDAVRAYLTEAARPYRSQQASPYQTGEPWAGLSIADPLTEWDYATRRDVLERSHLYWERNPIANAIISFNRLFALQNGAAITYGNTDVQAVCEAFLNHPENDWRVMEKELFDALLVDGELFVRFHETSGETIITALPAWAIQWIQHEPGFRKRVLDYRYTIRQDNGIGAGQAEYVNLDIPADEILHVAINKLAYEQRGRPELYRCFAWIQAYTNWLENRARHNHFKNVLYDVTLMNANANQVAAKRAQYKEPPSGAAIAIHNDKEAWQVMDTAVGANDVAEDGRKLFLMSAVGGRLPQYFLSDGENANLASATAQQLPAIRSFGEWQDIMAERVVVPLLRRVVQRAIASGLLQEEMPAQDSDGEDTGEMVKALEAFEVHYPELEGTDPKSVVDALVAAASQEWISDETAAALLPWAVDPQAEQKKIAAERARRRDEMAQGLRMAPPQAFASTPSGTGNGGGPPGHGQPPPEEEPEEEQAA